MKPMEWYKTNFGGGEFVLFPDGRISVPDWAVKFLIDKTGIKSKKRRIQQKVVKAEIQKLLRASNVGEDEK